MFVFQLLATPVLATLAVGFGVPILLAYVYGVVPFSLCRNGLCGVSTSSTGVRMEFDDETDTYTPRNPGKNNCIREEYQKFWFSIQNLLSGSDCKHKLIST